MLPPGDRRPSAVVADDTSTGTLREWLADQPPSTHPVTAAAVGRALAVEQPGRLAVRELADDLSLARDTADRVRRWPAEPDRVDPRVDAYLAKLVEHIVARWAEPAPS